MNYSRLNKKELLGIIKEYESRKFDDINEQLLLKNTELKKSQFLLEQSRDLYANLYDYSPVGLVTLDEKGIIKEINLTLAAMLGIERKNIPGTPFVAFVVKENIPAYLNYFRKILTANETNVILLPLSGENNKICYVQMYSNPIFDHGSSSILIQNTIIDITAKKITEDNLIESESRFRLMADSAPLFIWMVGTDKKISYLSKQWLTFTGSTLNLNPGNGWIKNVHPEDLENCLYIFNNAFQKQKEFVITYRVINTKGDYRWLLEQGVPRFTGKDFMGYIGSCIDFTEQKNIEMQLEKALHEKVILLQEIHHRVKNNLQIINSLLTLQSTYVQDEKFNEIINTSKNRIKTMALIHENLYQENDLSDIHIGYYLDRLINYILGSYTAPEQNIHLRKEIQEIKLDADFAIYIGMIVNELVTNSLKYAFKDRSDGEIYISFIKLEMKKYQLIISDNGIGLPVDFDTSEDKTLGFLLVNGFVAQLNGNLTINRNNGTSFKIIF